MWIFYSGGMLLPSLAPLDKADPKMTANGVRTLQIRGREAAHLRNFIKDYVDPMGFDHSPVEKTPTMDYTCRFYMRPEDFAEAVAQAVRDIDYRKFKESSERRDGRKLRYRSGPNYHRLLIDIWSTTARWKRPGGYWGRPLPTQRVDSDADWGTYDLDGALDYTPDSEVRKLSILNEVRDVPPSQWGSYLSDDELKLVLREHTAALKQEKRPRRRRNRKKAS